MSSPDMDPEIDIDTGADADALADAPIDNTPTTEPNVTEDPIGIMPNAVVMPMAERIAEP
jgi:hypothetical protein